MTDPTVSTEDRLTLDRLLRGFQISRMLRLAAELSIADRIEPDRTKRVEDLAVECGVHAAPLARILRALAGSDVFAVTTAGAISHSPLSLLLRSDTPNTMKHGAAFWTLPGSWNAWGSLDAALRGDVPQEVAWGVSRFDYLRDHPEEARAFDSFMAHMPDNRHAAIAASYDFFDARVIVDVGGGNGECLRHILSRFEHAIGIVFDRDDVVRAIPASATLNGRIAIKDGSFFDHVPEGGDVYLLVRVLHDWSDDDCLRILRTCRASMNAGATLLLGEQILDPDPTKDPTGYLLDTMMLAMFGEARERSEQEHAALLSRAGFALQRVVSTGSPVSVIDAVATGEPTPPK